MKYVKTSELTTQMILAEDIKTSAGTLFAAQGGHITLLLRIRLINLVQAKSIKEPIKVFVQHSEAKWIGRNNVCDSTPLN